MAKETKPHGETEHTAEDLLAQICLRQTEAIHLLYERYSSALFGVAVGLTQNQSDAEDVLQETFVKIWNRADRYDENSGKAISWMMTITRNTALDLLRSRKRKGKLVEKVTEESIEPAWTDETGSDVFFSKEKREAVKKAMAKLSDEQMIAIDLAFTNGLTQTEIAEMLQEPLGTIKARIRRGMQKLKIIILSDPELHDVI